MDAERTKPRVKALIEEYDAAIKAKFASDVYAIDPGEEENLIDGDDATEPFNDETELADANDFTPKEYDQLITAKVLLNQDEEKVVAEVVRRKRDHNGNPIGKRHENPLMDI